MSRRYYSKYKKTSHHKYKSSIQLFSKNEKQAFHILAEFIRLFIRIIVAIYEVIIEISIYARRFVKNHNALKDIGYDLEEILDLVTKITPRQFEIMIAELFKSTGKYTKVEITPPTADYGRDVILTANINGFEVVTFVEVKHYSKKNMVGREIAMKLLGSCATFGVEKAIIITTGTFHRNAYEIAGRVDNLRLMDYMDIEKMILDLNANQISGIMMRTLNAS